MTTKYLVQMENYTDFTKGMGSAYYTEAKFDTADEAIEYGFANAESTVGKSGAFRVVKKTIDEETFEITEKVVAKADYFWRVEMSKKAEEYKEEIEKQKKTIERAKTEKGRQRAINKIIKLEKEIAWIEERKAINAFRRYED